MRVFSGVYRFRTEIFSQSEELPAGEVVVYVRVDVAALGTRKLDESVGLLGGPSVAEIDEVPFLDLVLVLDVLRNIGVSVAIQVGVGVGGEMKDSSISFANP